MNRALGIALLVVALTACGGRNDEDPLRKAVQRYSDAYLAGDAGTAYSLLSGRCQNRVSRSAFSELARGAKKLYGAKQPLKTFKADINGTQARVTYTYSVSAINQTGEPWVKESGEWRQDDC